MINSGTPYRYFLLCLLASIFLMILIASGFNQYASSYEVDYSYSNKPVLTDPNFGVEIVAKGIRFPTSITFLGEDDMLVLEKNNGTVRRILNGTILPNALLDVNVANHEERGMLGIDTSSDNGSKYAFIYFTEMGDSGSSAGGANYGGEQALGNRLYRYEFLDGKLENPKLLLDLPVEPGSYHNGGVVKVGPDNSVYLVIGDVAYYDYFGSYPPLDGRSGILKVSKDSNSLANNNSLTNGDFDHIYYAYGIRNSFGMDFDPVTHKLWDTENGPGFGDEINLVERQFNSGWPMIQGIWKAENYSEGKIVLDPNKVTLNFGHYSSPEFTWRETVGPTAIKFIDSPNYGKNYEDDIIVGDFIEGNLYHFDLNSDRTKLALEGSLKDKIADTSEESKKLIFGINVGGITDIEIGPDGCLYISAIQRGGHNCNGSNSDDCIKYSSSEEGAIYKITSKAVDANPCS